MAFAIAGCVGRNRAFLGRGSCFLLCELALGVYSKTSCHDIMLSIYKRSAGLRAGIHRRVSDSQGEYQLMKKLIDLDVFFVFLHEERMILNLTISAGFRRIENAE